MVEIGGKRIFKETAAFELVPGVEITISGLPFGFELELEKDLPSPQPPLKGKRGPDGKPIISDRRTGKWETEPDYDDPDYKAAVEKRNRQQMAWIVYHGTKDDPAVKWETERGDDLESFYDGIYRELVDAQIGAGHIMRLVQAIIELSGVDQDRLDKVTSVFLSEKR